MNEYKKEKIRNIHYNNENEIQFEYGGQVHHYRMETLKEVFVNCWNLQQETKRLNGAIQTYDILLKANAEENKQLKEELEYTIGIVEHNRIISEKNKEIHQLKDNWNKLKEYLNYKSERAVGEDEYVYDEIYNEMQELEKESDSNE